MKCPKCSCKRDMIPVNSLSSSSGLLGQNTEQGTISGYQCMECHTWKDEDIQPVCPMPPKTGREIAEQKKTLLVGLDYKVYQHRNKITQIMDAGHGIAAVRDYLHEAYPDMNTSIKSVQVSYRRLVLGATAKRLGVEV